MLIIRWLLFLFILGTCTAKPPQIEPKDVKNKIEEIFKAHVTHKKATPELMKKSIQNFLEELDPTKTYFLSSEIQQWTDPSDELLQKTISGLKTAHFSIFEEIHITFLEAIERRNALENKIKDLPLPSKVKSDEFKDHAWAQKVDELENRLLRIKSLQFSATEALGDHSQEKFIQRINKRRINRESEFIGQNKEERFKITLSCVLKSIASALDSHTNYFTPSEANQFMIQVQQRLFGIGAQLRDDLDGLSIVRILENSPASQSNKLKINDKIIAVGNEPIVGFDIAEAVDLIRGEKGTPVRLTVFRELGS